MNNETAAILVFQTNPVGVGLFSYVKISFVPINLHRCWPREWIRFIHVHIITIVVWMSLSLCRLKREQALALAFVIYTFIKRANLRGKNS